MHCRLALPTTARELRSRFQWLARCVLAWFVLAIGVAVASPWVSPQSLELVCSGSGPMKLLVKSADGGEAPLASHSLDCPLCTQLGAPPPTTQAQLPLAQPLAHALRFIPAAHVAARTAAPLPPRGPPAFS